MEAVASMKGSVSGRVRVGGSSLGRSKGSRGSTMTGTMVCHGSENPEDGFADGGARNGRETAKIVMHKPPQNCNYENELRLMVNTPIRCESWQTESYCLTRCEAMRIHLAP